jgi:hypothetical protein
MTGKLLLLTPVIHQFIKQFDGIYGHVDRSIVIWNSHHCVAILLNCMHVTSLYFQVLGSLESPFWYMFEFDWLAVVHFC